MRQTAKTAERADEDFERFARAFMELAGDWIGKQADVDEQMARLRAVLVDGAEARAQASAQVLRTWRALSEAGSGTLAPFAWMSAEEVALGPNREHQESVRRLQEHTASLQKAFDHFSALLAPLPAEAFAQFATLARELASAGRPFESLRAVYEAWIEASDATYAVLAHTEAFGLAQSALNDAFLALRAEQKALLERAARQFDLPTRSELDSVHRQLRALRREVASLRVVKAAKPRVAPPPSRPARRRRPARPK